MATERSAPRGIPEDYREFVRQIEDAAERNSARNKALAWRDASLEKRSRTICELLDMAATLARQTGVKKRPLNYPQLPDVQWIRDHTS